MFVNDGGLAKSILAQTLSLLISAPSSVTEKVVRQDKIMKRAGTANRPHLDLDKAIWSDQTRTVGCDFTFRSDHHTYGEKTPDGATMTLTQEEMEKQIAEGEGYDTPKEASNVKFAGPAATDGSVTSPGFAEKDLEYAVGNGELGDALECAAASAQEALGVTLTQEEHPEVKDVSMSKSKPTGGSVALPGLALKTLEFAVGNVEVCDAMECAVSEMKKGEKAMPTGIGDAVASAQEAQCGLNSDLANEIWKSCLRCDKKSSLVDYDGTYCMECQDEIDGIMMECDVEHATWAKHQLKLQP